MPRRRHKNLLPCVLAALGVCLASQAARLGNPSGFIEPVAIAHSGVPADPAIGAAPPPAFSVGAAFDAVRQRLIVFGGFFRGQYFGDTWEWDGDAWTERPEPGPSARNSPRMVYDEARGRVLLFGGDTRQTGALGDTWEREGVIWRHAASSGPSPRTVHAMTYDPHRGRVVLFGGATAGRVLGDTWEWDGRRWSLVASEGPPARALHGLAYDASRRRVVLFGGTPAIAPDVQPLRDTWEWDGRAWTQRHVAGPSPRDHTSMAYDAAREVIVLHGGGTTPDARAETWTFDGSAWRRLAASGPRRMNPALVFDPSARALLLFGGFNAGPSNELWRLAGPRWARLWP